MYLVSEQMSIQWNLKVMMAKRDISAIELQEKTGLSYSTIIKLRNNPPERLDMGTLSLLCKSLKCTVADLLEYIPDNDAA